MTYALVFTSDLIQDLNLNKNDFQDMTFDKGEFNTINRVELHVPSHPCVMDG